MNEEIIIPLSALYGGRCANCQERFTSNEEKYCKHCGAKRGMVEFISEENVSNENIIECIYGPMFPKRTYRCVKCGYQWTCFTMFDDREKCVRCGGDGDLIDD